MKDKNIRAVNCKHPKKGILQIAIEVVSLGIIKFHDGTEIKSSEAEYKNNIPKNKVGKK